MSSRSDVLRVMWHPKEDVDEAQFSRRRLYETSPAVASLAVFASDFTQAERGMDGGEVIVNRLKQAVDDDELLDALMSQNGALGDAFDGEVFKCWTARALSYEGAALTIAWPVE